VRVSLRIVAIFVSLAGAVVLSQSQDAVAQGAAKPTVQIFDALSNQPISLAEPLELEKVATRRCGDWPEFSFAASAMVNDLPLLLSGGNFSKCASNRFAVEAVHSVRSKRGAKWKRFLYQGELVPNTPGGRVYGGLLIQQTKDSKPDFYIKVRGLVVADK